MMFGNKGITYRSQRPVLLASYRVVHDGREINPKELECAATARKHDRETSDIVLAREVAEFNKLDSLAIAFDEAKRCGIRWLNVKASGKIGTEFYATVIAVIKLGAITHPQTQVKYSATKGMAYALTMSAAFSKIKLKLPRDVICSLDRCNTNTGCRNVS
jgi:hypothetical protein